MNGGDNQTGVGGSGMGFDLPGHSIADLRMAVLKPRNCEGRFQCEIAEMEFVHKFGTVGSIPWAEQDTGFLSQDKANVQPLSSIEGDRKPL